MTPVFERLAELGIGPQAEVTTDQETTANDELRDRVTRRAAELRQAWSDDNDDEAFDVPRADRWLSRRRAVRTADSSSLPDVAPEGSPAALDRDDREPGPPALARPPRLPVDRAGTPAPASAGDDVTAILQDHQIEYVDKRPNGGALWALGGTELSSVMSDLAKRGFRFTFSKNGGRATDHRPSWWFAK